jgi:predicted nucleic acid-binding protein
LVINETLQFLQIKGFLSAALHFLLEAQRGTLGQIIYVDAGLQTEGWRIFQKFGGSGASPVDCVSFAIMKRFSIQRAYTFDRHFAAAGFQILA